MENEKKIGLASPAFASTLIAFTDWLDVNATGKAFIYIVSILALGVLLFKFGKKEKRKFYIMMGALFLMLLLYPYLERIIAD